MDDLGVTQVETDVHPADFISEFVGTIVLKMDRKSQSRAKR